MHIDIIFNVCISVTTCYWRSQMWNEKLWKFWQFHARFFQRLKLTNYFPLKLLYYLMLNMEMFTYVIKVSSKILPLSYPFVNISFQDWSPLCADVIFDTIVSPPLHFEKRKILLLNFHGLSANIRAFLLTFWVFWAFWNDKRKIERQQKNEFCIRNADLPCWWQRTCWKTLFRLCSSKVETKN